MEEEEEEDCPGLWLRRHNTWNVIKPGQRRTASRPVLNPDWSEGGDYLIRTAALTAGCVVRLEKESSVSEVF